MAKRIFLLILLLGLALPLQAAPFAWVVEAYDLTATSYTYCTANPAGSTPVCGTAITNGWISIPSGRPIVAAIEWTTKAATSLEYSIECRPWTGGLGAYLATVGQASMTSASASYVVIGSNYNGFDQCRIGLKLTTDTGTNAVTAYFATR
jgi:hypothetical protein